MNLCENKRYIKNLALLPNTLNYAFGYCCHENGVCTTTYEGHVGVIELDSDQKLEITLKKKTKNLDKIERTLCCNIH